VCYNSTDYIDVRCRRPARNTTNNNNKQQASSEDYTKLAGWKVKEELSVISINVVVQGKGGDMNSERSSVHDKG